MACCPRTNPGRGTSLNRSSSAELSINGLEELDEDPAKETVQLRTPNQFEARQTWHQLRHILFSRTARHRRSHVLQLFILQLQGLSSRADSLHSRAAFRALTQALRHRVDPCLQDHIVGTNLLQL